MYLLLAFVFFGFSGANCCPGSCSIYAAKDYALYFPNKGVTDFANVWRMPSLSQFTSCFWIKNNVKDRFQQIFSYAVSSQNRELKLGFRSGGFGMTIGGNAGNTLGSRVDDGKWHHICFSWNNDDGALKLYQDGVPVGIQKGLQKGYTIKEGGFFVLGQHINDESEFVSRSSLEGFLAHFNLWSCELSQEVIKKMSKSCLQGEGDVYKWSDFKHNIRGNTTVFIPSPCVPLEE